MAKMLWLPLLVLTCLNIPWSGCGQECSVGKKPQNLGDGSESAPSGLFLNTQSSIACNDTVIQWRFCYYVVISPEAMSASKPTIEIDFGIWQKTNGNGSTLYSLVNSTRWSPVSTVLSSSYDFVCQKLDLTSKQQFTVDSGDELVVGVYIPAHALNASHTIHFVGRVSNDSTVYHHGGNWTDIEEGIDSDSLSPFNDYGLYLEAEIGAGRDISSTEEPQETAPTFRTATEADSQLPLWTLFIIAVLLTVMVSLVSALLTITWKFRRTHRMTKYRLDTLRGPQRGLMQELRARDQQDKEEPAGTMVTETGFLNPLAAASEQNDMLSPQGEADRPTVITPQDPQASYIETETRQISATSLRLPEQVFVRSRSAVPARRLRRSKSDGVIALIDPALHMDQQGVWPGAWPPLTRDEGIYEDLDGGDGQEKRPYSQSTGPAGLHQLQTAGSKLYAFPTLPGEFLGSSGQRGQLHSNSAGHIALQSVGDDLYATPTYPSDILSSLESEGYAYPYYASHTMPGRQRSEKRKHATMSAVVPPRNIPRRPVPLEVNDPRTVSPDKRTVSHSSETVAALSIEEKSRKPNKREGEVPEIESNAAIQPSLTSATAVTRDDFVESMSSTLSEGIYMNEDEYPVNFIGVRPAQDPTSTAPQPPSTADQVCVPAWKNALQETYRLSGVSTGSEGIYMNEDEYPIQLPVGKSESFKSERPLMQGDGGYTPLLEVTREEQTVYEDPKQT